ncbi:MAG TPA: MoxR family ATPase [Verrucomicrobia bacterium]|nr:MoxR family ATPase [Verrucomicrobiales bacterium]HIL55215.1 MoxR family ATPase [Verrucomicrobiota bacterium]
MRNKLDFIYQRLTRTVIGSEEPAFLMIVGLLSDGHMIIQGAPGIGKTTLAETLAKSIDGSFSRVQFTPDLLSSDLLGYSIYHQGKEFFEFVPGPVFSNVLLADEINRTSPRIQSALLECMNERQVSIDGVTRPLSPPFMVIATQNSIHSTGTFALPEPQLDRFLISVNMTLPDRQTQSKILMLHAENNESNEGGDELIDVDELVRLQSEVKAIPVSEKICQYIIDLCESVRRQRGMLHSISARAAIALMRASQAVAYLEGNPAVFPEDVKRIVGPVFSHRLALGDGFDGGVNSSSGLIEEILKETKVP